MTKKTSLKQCVCGFYVFRFALYCIEIVHISCVFDDDDVYVYRSLYNIDYYI